MGFKFMTMTKATDGKHKYVVELFNTETKRTKTIKFGASGMKDYTLYQKEGKDIADERKSAYIARHSKTEDWTKSGVDTRGFWSRWVLWNLPTITASVADAKKRI
jgi:hypothetical protein